MLKDGLFCRLRSKPSFKLARQTRLFLSIGSENVSILCDPKRPVFSGSHPAFIPILPHFFTIDTVNDLLNRALSEYNRPDFVETDPISIPHRFTKLQDREIAGFWAATIAWGNRKSIINSANTLVELMDHAPHDFMLNHQETDRKRFLDFKHRTFQSTDTLYFLEFFQQYYRQNHSLETAFSQHLTAEDAHVENALKGFHQVFFDHPFAPARTRKHIATPARGSTCKRLNMFLRWMVRRDPNGVDFGIWTQIQPRQLLIPLDVHVDAVARKLGLLQRKQTDWLAVLELTDTLRQFSPDDPVQYDFALFGLGVAGKTPLF